MSDPERRCGNPGLMSFLLLVLSVLGGIACGVAGYLWVSVCP